MGCKRSSRRFEWEGCHEKSVEKSSGGAAAGGALAAGGLRQFVGGRFDRTGCVAASRAARRQSEGEAGGARLSNAGADAHSGAVFAGGDERHHRHARSRAISAHRKNAGRRSRRWRAANHGGAIAAFERRAGRGETLGCLDPGAASFSGGERQRNRDRAAGQRQLEKSELFFRFRLHALAATDGRRSGRTGDGRRPGARFPKPPVR